MYKIIGADLKEYGPVGIDQIRQWMAEGRVNGQSKIQAEGSTEWKTVAELPELAALLPARPGPIVMGAPPVPGNNPLAVWALVTGIVSLVCCQIMGVVSIVLGAVALSQIKNNPSQKGKGFAVAGLVLGGIAILMMILAAAALYLFPNLLEDLQNKLNQQ